MKHIPCTSVNAKTHYMIISIYMTYDNLSKRTRTLQNRSSNESTTCVNRKSNILAIGSKQTSRFNRLLCYKGILKTSIAVTLHTNIETSQPHSLLQNKNTNWTLIKIMLCENLNVNLPLKNSEDIEEAIEYLNSSIQNAAWGSTKQLHQTEKCSS